MHEKETRTEREGGRGRGRERERTGDRKEEGECLKTRERVNHEKRGNSTEKRERERGRE